MRQKLHEPKLLLAAVLISLGLLLLGNSNLLEGPVRVSEKELLRLLAVVCCTGLAIRIFRTGRVRQS